MPIRCVQLVKPSPDTKMGTGKLGTLYLQGKVNSQEISHSLHCISPFNASLSGAGLVRGKAKEVGALVKLCGWLNGRLSFYKSLDMA